MDWLARLVEISDREEAEALCYRFASQPEPHSEAELISIGQAILGNADLSLWLPKEFVHTVVAFSASMGDLSRLRPLERQAGLFIAYHLGQPALLIKLDKPEASIKNEQLAYLLERELVPFTLYVALEGRPPFDKPVLASVQRYLPDAKSFHQVDKGALRVDQVHQLAHLDVLLGNRDRHWGNILVQEGHIVAIDHVLSLPKKWGRCRYAWLSLTQSKEVSQPWGDETWYDLLRSHGVCEEAIQCTQYRVLLERICLEQGLSYFEIGWLLAGLHVSGQESSPTAFSQWVAGGDFERECRSTTLEMVEWKERLQSVVSEREASQMLHKIETPLVQAMAALWLADRGLHTLPLPDRSVRFHHFAPDQIDMPPPTALRRRMEAIFGVGATTAVWAKVAADELLPESLFALLFAQFLRNFHPHSSQTIDRLAQAMRESVTLRNSAPSGVFSLLTKAQVERIEGEDGRKAQLAYLLFPNRVPPAIWVQQESGSPLALQLAIEGCDELECLEAKEVQRLAHMEVVLGSIGAVWVHEGKAIPKGFKLSLGEKCAISGALWADLPQASESVDPALLRLIESEAAEDRFALLHQMQCKSQVIEPLRVRTMVEREFLAAGSTYRDILNALRRVDDWGKGEALRQRIYQEAVGCNQSKNRR